MISISIIRNTSPLARRLRFVILAIAKLFVCIENLATRALLPSFIVSIAERFLARAQKVAELIPWIGDCFAIESTRRQLITFRPIVRATLTIECLVIRAKVYTIVIAFIAFNVLLTVNRMEAYSRLTARPARHNRTDLCGSIAVIIAEI